MGFISVTSTAATAELILLVFILGCLVFAAVEMYLEDAPIRDEDEELGVTRWTV